MGFSAAIPKGYSADIHEGDVVTLLRDTMPAARLVVSLSGWLVNEQSLELTFARYIKTLESELEEPLKLRRRLARVATPFGEALSRT